VRISSPYFLMTGVALLMAFAPPLPLVAVTTTSRRCPMYFALIVKVFFVAPLIAWHFLAFALQTSHRYLYAIGTVPVQVPLLAVSLLFFFFLPLIVGRTIFLGVVAVDEPLYINAFPS
jgi:hypothetical protein